ncbi:MAG: glycosyltransferase family 2 protein [Sphingobacteriales bacterium]|nr:MAG: glycosyltransferase family 2 protein [Sphingobacteriales bacterium]
MKEPLVSIITVNFNQTLLTCQLLSSVEKLEYSNIEVIVVDNGSLENPSKHIEEMYPSVNVIRSEVNYGFAGGNNLGLRASKGDYLFFVNNDTELNKDCIGKLLEVFEKNLKVGVVSPKINFYQSPEFQKQSLIQYAGYTRLHPITARNHTIGEFEIDTGQYNQAVQTFYAHGAAMMVKREVIERVGEMPELYFLYYEELDWCEQIRKAGFEIMVEPNAVIYHKESMSVGKESPVKTYYLTRNRILFMRRNSFPLNFGLFIIYFALVIFPKTVLIFLLQRQTSYLKSFFAAIYWHFKHIDNNNLPSLASKQVAV